MSDEGASEAGHGSHGLGTAGIGVLALGALGVVFGDIGTSPLYAFREAFEHQDLAVTETNALGVASIAFWALVIIISIKYLALVMRADNHGEGGILALTALVIAAVAPARRSPALVLLGVFGTALLYGDGLITPAISVLSAVEGFEVASSAFDDFVIPIAVRHPGRAVPRAEARHGRRRQGVRAGDGAVVRRARRPRPAGQVLDHPSVLEAVNPVNIVQFFAAEPGKAFLALGSIFLVVTGGEALYADMGHFGRKPIAVGLVRHRAARAASSTTSARPPCSSATPRRSRARSTGWRPTGRSRRWPCSPPWRRSSPRRR